MGEHPRSGDLDRRQVLRKAMIGAGAAVSAPLIVTSLTTPASAASSDPVPVAACVSTSTNQRTISGTAQPNATVYVYRTAGCSDQIATATATNLGTFAVTFNVNSVGSPGPYYVAQDADGSGIGACSGAITC